MGLLSIFKRSDDDSRPAAVSNDPNDEVTRARIRARQRLIGAAVLVVIGIIGFPLVFETQPRPIPVDIPIEIPRKEGAPPLVMPPARGTAPREARPASAPASAAVLAAPAETVITESRDEAGKPVASAPAAASAAVAAASKPATAAPAKPAEPKPEAKPEQKAETKPDPKVEATKAAEQKAAEQKAAEQKAAAAAKSATEAARAKALLEGKQAAAKPEPPKPEPTKAEDGRFVVQVGAFADAAAARETRLKAEKLGIKTYTQVASTAAGNRIRVRLGPFASREEAEKALAKAKSAGLTAVVLTL